MAYELYIEPKAERFMKKLKKKNSDAASTIATHILELKKDPHTPAPCAILSKLEAV
jgi:mRNA-degrading endonuclease RelE of RelBE toxin-antitoxin system